jgi:hypothetical protein
MILFSIIFPQALAQTIMPFQISTTLVVNFVVVNFELRIQSKKTPKVLMESSGGWGSEHVTKNKVENLVNRPFKTTKLC